MHPGTRRFEISLEFQTGHGCRDLDPSAHRTIFPDCLIRPGELDGASMCIQHSGTIYAAATRMQPLAESRFVGNHDLHVTVQSRAEFHEGST